MKKARPIVSNLEEIIITRQSEGVIIEYVDSNYGTTHLQMPPKAVRELSDEEIMAFYNAELKERAKHAAANPYIATEVPLNSNQIEYHSRSNQWTPRGDVLRCEINDADGMEPVIEIDDKELSLQEFGRLLCTYAGWGMRIEFVPDDAIHRRPALRVQEPDNLS